MNDLYEMLMMVKDRRVLIETLDIRDRDSVRVAASLLVCMFR